MQVSPLAFQLLTVCGCWRPAFCASPRRRAIYGAYSTLTVSLVYSAVIWQIVGVLSVDNVDDFIENSYLPLSMMGSCCKMANLLIYHGRIAELVDRLTEDPHKPADAAEASIRDKYDKIVRWVARLDPISPNYTGLR